MESGFVFNWDSDSEEEFFGFLEDELDVVCAPVEEEEEGEGEDNFTVCGGEGDASREWMDVTGEMVATEEERKRSDGRTPFNETNSRPATTHHQLCLSFYTSTGACGTVRVNRKGMPPQLRSLKLRPSDPPVFFENAPLLSASFRDAGTVTVLSTVHDNRVINKQVRSKGPSGYRVVRKPKSVEDYNRFMGGVDRGDQLCSYCYQHRAMKWYHRLSHHIREVALVNAHIIFKESGNSMLAASFRQLVAKGLLRSRQVEMTPPPGPRSATCVPVRLTGRHFLPQFERSRPDCKVCSSRKRSPEDARPSAKFMDQSEARPPQPPPKPRIPSKHLECVLQSPPPFLPVPCPTASHSQSGTALLERDQMILRALEEIKAQVRQNTLLLQALAKKQPVQRGALSDEYNFPMKNEEDLKRVEDMLREKEQEKALTSYLSTFGGSSTGDTIRRIMRHIISNQFAAQFNWLGRGNKRAFAALKLASIIRGAAAQHDITASACESHIKNWLKYSTDRNGGRKRRAEKQQKDQSSSSELDSDSETRKRQKEKHFTQPLLKPPPVFRNINAQHINSERDHALLRAVEDLKALVRQNNLLLQALTRRQQPVHELELSDAFQFPMDSVEDLQRVENALKEKCQEKALTKFLCSLGGCNVGDIVRRILRHILTDSFAIEFNWLGRGGKKLAFASYKICDVPRSTQVPRSNVVYRSWTQVATTAITAAWNDGQMTPPTHSYIHFSF
ncbi:hypothetical protein ACEWY4_006136 [Coilia grayii]|uniref:DUF4806 domain-containing protein n=1 Tax=Coilia grayii TaxID=363190 RepID=A0ABD1KCL2_9TELE